MVAETLPLVAARPGRCRILGEATVHLAPAKPWSGQQQTLCGAFGVLVETRIRGALCRHCARRAY